MRLFDMHCDTLYECFQTRSSLKCNTLHIDLQRGQAFDAWVQIFAAWIPDSWQGELAFSRCREILQMAYKQAALYSEDMLLVQTASDMEAAQSTHRCGALLAVEGGTALAGKLEYVKELAEDGVKVMTLTWNGSNELGNGCLSGREEGLTSFGKAAVKELENCQIIVDVSHLNPRGFWDVAEISEKPFIASHSVSRKIHEHPRNLTDEQFSCIRDRGGLVGLNLCADQLGKQSFEQFERHLYHFLSLDGDYTVGFGCDFDGTSVPDEWKGIAVMEELYNYLCRKNYDESCLERLFFSNCYDFFRAALTI